MYTMIILIVLFVIFLIVYKKKRIDLEYVCENGKFRIKGIKNDFKIFKNDRFVFHVVNGQVVSFTDRMIGEDIITYGGGQSGDV